MSFDTERKKTGNEPVTVFEIDLPVCTKLFGVTCNATGEPCYQTRTTCKDVSSYEQQLKTYRWADNMYNWPVGVECQPGLKPIRGLPTNANPKDGLSKRASLNVRIDDEKGHDRRFDPYHDQRLEPASGTPLSRLYVRNERNYQGRTARVRRGYLTEPFSWDNFSDRTYVLSQIIPPSGGTADFKIKDPLERLNKTKLPFITKGEVERAVDDVIDTIHFYGKLEEYTSGIVKIGSEFISYGDVKLDLQDPEDPHLALYDCVRGVLGSKSASHQVGEQVQNCEVFSNISAYQCIKQILKAAKLDHFLDEDEGQEVDSFWYAGQEFYNVISKPVAANKLIEEIALQAAAYVFWDERDQKIRFRSINPLPFNQQPRLLDDTTKIKKDSFTIKPDLSKQVTAVLMRYGRLNFNDSKKAENYTHAVVVLSDSGNEDLHDNDNIEEIFADFITSEDDALEASSRRLNLLKDGLTEYELEISARHSEEWTADQVDILHDELVGYDGKAQRTRCQIVESHEKDGLTVKYKVIRFAFGGGSSVGGSGNGRLAHWAPDDAPTYSEATEEEKESMAYWATDDPATVGDDQPYEYY